MRNGTQAGGCGGVITLLQVAFIALKITGTINWSWWWVMAPTWIPLSIALVELGIFLWLIKR